MPKTLLVVDDSATMRKVFELTFAGEDVAVVGHDGSESVMARARDARPAVAVVDVGLGQTTGYDVCRNLKRDAALGGVPVVLLYSEQSPLDEGRAREAGADGSLLKPFDTQVAIDKLRPYLQGGAAAVAAPGPAPAQGFPAAPTGAAALRSTHVSAVAPPPSRAPTSTGFGSVGSMPAVNPPPGVLGMPNRPVTTPHGAAPAPTNAAPAPKAAPLPVAAPVREDAEIEVEMEMDDDGPASSRKPTPMQRPAVSPPMAVARSAAAEVQQRVQGMGLSPAQVEAVTALTRVVVERIVWEVVPQLAETLIREEIRRLTAE